MEATRQGPTDGMSHWSSYRLAKKLGLGIQPQRSRGCMVSHDPLVRRESRRNVVDNGGCFFSDNALGVGFLLVGYGGQMRQQTPPAGVEFHAAKAAAFHDCRILPTMPSAASSLMSKRPHGKDSSCSLANLPIDSPLTLKVAAACSLQSKRETGNIPSSQSRPLFTTDPQPDGRLVRD
jgi:hypothetical protein